MEMINNKLGNLNNSNYNKLNLNNEAGKNADSALQKETRFKAFGPVDLIEQEGIKTGKEIGTYLAEKDTKNFLRYIFPTELKYALRKKLKNLKNLVIIKKSLKN